MRISEQRVFNFAFPYFGNQEIGFAVLADSQDDAAKQLQKWMTSALSELHIQFPSKPQSVAGTIPVAETIAPSSLNDLQRGHLERLIAQFAPYRHDVQPSIEETIKKWVDVDLTSLSYIGAVQLLEQLLNEYKTGITVIDSTESHGDVISKTESAETAEKKKKTK